MEGLNKAVSFILGLIVVVLVIAVLTGKINLFKSGNQSVFSGGIFSHATPTPSPVPTGATNQTVNLETNSAGVTPTNNYHNYQSNQSGRPAQSIPSTGPEWLIPIVVSSLSAGLLLKRSA
ncbi:hypothetical protein M1523_04730 [Patescibacteria group bacterium]|nr:hypothetical protein [Patescibacteria group bacterium]